VMPAMAIGRPGRVFITGMELTQSIQTPENQIPLVADKVTFVRVYVQAEADSAGAWSGVGARLRVSGITISISPVTPTIKVSVAGSDRRTLNDSFIFELSGAAVAVGERNFDVQLIPPSGRPIGDTSGLHASIPAHFYAVSGFSAYGVCYGYTGVDMAT